jgi:hypothetical protein
MEDLEPFDLRTNVDDLQAFDMYQKILDFKKFYTNYAEHQGNYSNTIQAFDRLLRELDDTLIYGKLRMLAKSRDLADKLIGKNLEWRRNFVSDNKLKKLDVNELRGLITANIASNLPTLELFPGVGQFLPYAVAGEPLYVIDRYMEIIDEAAAVLNNEFYTTRRLRKYVVSDYNLSQLPQESFGLVYCFNEFFQADEQYIYNWACEVYKLLESGGKFIFNFLPYDQHWAIKATFTKIYSVIDYKSLIEKLKDFGYELDNCEIKEFCASYICIKKPGTLAPRIKNSGSIAEIIDI